MQHIQSTPPEVLEEHNKVASQAVARIHQGEKLCTEVVELISVMWKSILEDETVENIKEDALQDNENISALKAEMKKLSLK